jgi:hypothetical protein
VTRRAEDLPLRGWLRDRADENRYTSVSRVRVVSQGPAMMHHHHPRVVIALRYKRIANVSTHLPLPSLRSAGKPRVGAAATNDGPGVSHGRRYNNHTPSLPPFWIRTATNTIHQTLIWRGMTKGLIRCRRCVGKHDGFSSAFGWRDAVGPGMVPPHAQVSSAYCRRVAVLLARGPKRSGSCVGSSAACDATMAARAVQGMAS